MVVVGNWRAPYLLAGMALLVACGGGGGADEFDEGPKPTVGRVLNPDLAPEPGTQQIKLRGTEGDQSRYIGRWESECLEAEAVLPGFPKSLVNVYYFTEVEGTTVRGHLVQWRYADRQCRTFDRTDNVTGGVALQVRQTSELPTESRSAFSGTMDAVHIEYDGASFRSFKGLKAIGFSARFKQFVGVQTESEPMNGVIGGSTYTRK